VLHTVFQTRITAARGATSIHHPLPRATAVIVPGDARAIFINDMAARKVIRSAAEAIR